MQRILAFLKNHRNLLWIYLGVSLIAILHRWWLGPEHLRNFLIFREATFHFFAGKDIYQHETAMGLELDLFKYSPAFALLFAPFAYVPVWAGYLSWNLFNVLALYFSISRFPFLRDKLWILLILVFFDTLTALQNSQSNALMAALMINAMADFEKGKPGQAAWALVSSFFIKLFSGVAFVLFLFYPGKIRFLLTSAFAFLFLALLPIVIVGSTQLQFLYQSWFDMLRYDQATWRGISVPGILYSWFGLDVPRTPLQLASMLLLLAPLVFFKSFEERRQRLLFFASLMIWVIVFNHRAESATFVIAMCGMGFWYFCDTPNRWRLALLLFAVLFVSLSPTDLFPRIVRKQFVEPYCLKALPALIGWIVIQYELYRNALRKAPGSFVLS